MDEINGKENQVKQNGVFAGRYTAQMDEPFVVFLIGMRVNRFFAFRKWLPTAAAMPKMLQELYAHPEKGFLGGESFFNPYPFATLMVSYWRSFDELERFARSKDDPHLPAWKEFMKWVGGDGSVGIWHETYVIPAGHYETIYGNMPRFGLAAATQHIPITGRLNSMRGRVGQIEQSEIAVTTMHQYHTEALER